MPNMTPDQLNARAAAARAARTPAGCTNGNCVSADVQDDGVHVTSTIEGNHGLVVFTHDEWAAFIGQAKAGQWDHTVRETAFAV